MAKVVVRRLSRVATAEDGGLLLLGPMPPDHQHYTLHYSLSMYWIPHHVDTRGLRLLPINAAVWRGPRLARPFTTRLSRRVTKLKPTLLPSTYLCVLSQFCKPMHHSCDHRGDGPELRSTATGTVQTVREPWCCTAALGAIQY